ncbi:Mrp/NBP35 family ATP-binding protein [Bacillus sp. FJAT-45350]|uniref:Mrp/NBP35 family ATP-binding protein n=1 Tax=Bacillus sp. FJAT-45350 TaxID=2011014 RepID=UPI000BB91D2E|nr:Mrp/NBP35 family ATP-binding protein [Bacillus sp. FJAT-45350]
MITGHVIAVISGKGGVGKSTVAVNLALALSRLKKKVAIIDLDIYGYSVPSILEIEERPGSINSKLIPVMSHGISVMSPGFMVRGNKPISWRGPALGVLVERFLEGVVWGDTDYVILDMPPGTGDVALDMQKFIPHCKNILVTTPHPTATYVAERAGTMALRANHELLGIVENMSYFSPPTRTDEQYYLFGRGGGESLAKTFNTELLAAIPMTTANEDGTVPQLFKKDSILFPYYNQLATKVDTILNTKELQA